VDVGGERAARPAVARTALTRHSAPAPARSAPARAEAKPEGKGAEKGAKPTVPPAPVAMGAVKKKVVVKRR
jgi:hypothetical protein